MLILSNQIGQLRTVPLCLKVTVHLTLLQRTSSHSKRKQILPIGEFPLAPRKSIHSVARRNYKNILIEIMNWIKVKPHRSTTSKQLMPSWPPTAYKKPSRTATPTEVRQVDVGATSHDHWLVAGSNLYTAYIASDTELGPIFKNIMYN